MSVEERLEDGERSGSPAKFSLESPIYLLWPVKNQATMADQLVNGQPES
jgi:hypothetical protein